MFSATVLNLILNGLASYCVLRLPGHVLRRSQLNMVKEVFPCDRDILPQPLRIAQRLCSPFVFPVLHIQTKFSTWSASSSLRIHWASIKMYVCAWQRLRIAKGFLVTRVDTSPILLRFWFWLTRPRSSVRPLAYHHSTLFNWHTMHLVIMTLRTYALYHRNIIVLIIASILGLYCMTLLVVRPLI